MAQAVETSLSPPCCIGDHVPEQVMSSGGDFLTLLAKGFFPTELAPPWVALPLELSLSLYKQDTASANRS